MVLADPPRYRNQKIPFNIIKQLSGDNIHILVNKFQDLEISTGRDNRKNTKDQKRKKSKKGNK